MAINISSAATVVYHTNASGNMVPLATLNHIALSNKTSEGLNTKIAAGGVIKRAYVPHDLTPIISYTSTPLPADSTIYNTGDRYILISSKIDPSTNEYVPYKALCAFQQVSGEWTWVEAEGGMASSATMTPAEVEAQRGQRIYVDITTNRMYHWHNNDFVQVGFSAEDVSAIASAVAVSVVAEYEGQHDQLRTYQVINE